MIRLDVQRCWLDAAADSVTNRRLAARLFPAIKQALTELFLAELRGQYRDDDAGVLVDPAPWLQAALHRHGIRFRYEVTEVGTLPNVSSSRYYD